MNARLKVLIGDAVGETIEVPQGKYLIGREADCQLRRQSAFMSRHHCALLLDEYTLRLRDLGSKNGTFVNGRRIAGGEAILLDGDLVAVGEITFEVILVQPLAGRRLSPSGLDSVTARGALETIQVVRDDTIHFRQPTDHSPATPEARPIQFLSAPARGSSVQSEVRLVDRRPG
jgi:pSer/pThr/pTyr-binding forkhead associated (FHA) protein